VERKLVEEKNEVLDEKEKSKLWKNGVIYYNIAFPFAIAANIVFFTQTIH
jgi:hypothetical protein